MEAYSDSFYTTGVTYQADNQPTPTTIKGAGVDVSTLNIIGLGGTLDWGVHAYDPTGANGVDPRNGGIVGSISYDTTRNELDPRYAAAEDWQPGIPDIPVKLYATVDCGTDARRPLRRGRATTSWTPTAPTGTARCSTATCRRTGSRPPAARPATSTATRWSTASTRTTWPSTRRPTAICIPAFSAEHPVRHLLRPTRARRTPTSAPPSTATTASATAASTAPWTPPTPPTRSAWAARFTPLGARRLPGRRSTSPTTLPATRSTR